MLTIKDHRDGKKMHDLTTCEMQNGWCDINPVKSTAENAVTDSWSIMNTTFQALATGDPQIIQAEALRAVSKALTNECTADSTQSVIVGFALWAEEQV